MNAFSNCECVRARICVYVCAYVCVCEKNREPTNRKKDGVFVDDCQLVHFMGVTKNQLFLQLYLRIDIAALGTSP